MSLDTNLFGSAVVTLAHHYLTRLHPWAADICCALAAERLQQGNFVRTFHPGAGFGADMRMAELYGAREVVGVEINPEQVSLFDFLEQASDGVAEMSIWYNPVASALYPRKALERVGRMFVHEQAVLRWPYVATTSVRMLQGDVRKLDTLKDLEGSCNAIIGNIMLHWLVDQAGSVRSALDTLSAVLQPGGIAVFSVPYHFIEETDLVQDESRRQHCLYDHPIYLRFNEILLGRLEQKFGITLPMISFRKVRQQLVREEELLCCRSLQLAGGLCRFFASTPDEIPDVLRGLGFFEAVMRTGRPGPEVVDCVAAAVDELCQMNAVTQNMRPFGTYVNFYVFQKQ